MDGQNDLASRAMDGLFAVGKRVVALDRADAAEIERRRRAAQHAPEVLGVHRGDGGAPLGALAEGTDDGAVFGEEAGDRRAIVVLQASEKLSKVDSS